MKNVRSFSFCPSFPLLPSTPITMSQRNFKTIDLANFQQRKESIVKDIMTAATEQGFFYGMMKKKVFLTAT
jgi:hypothetical protein